MTVSYPSKPTMSKLLGRIRRKLVSGIRRRLFSGTSKVPNHRIDSVETYHLDPDVAELVRTRMLTGEPKGQLDGDRSARLPHPSKAGLDIKIKGAGLNLGPVRFGRRHHSRLRAPVFDFEGRMMEDVAAGHDAAWLGGASFQQVTTEYRMAALLASKGYEVLPCLGYGRITSNGMASWVSVHETASSWISCAVPEFPLDEFSAAMEAQGRLQLELAVRHELIGYGWWVGTPGGPRVLKDLHAFRRADPVNMSQISWTMQLFFCLHIQALSGFLYYARKNAPETIQADLQVVAFRAAYPEVTVADHEALRRDLVAPYMLGPPQGFDIEALLRVLTGNPITAALMDMCPPQYSRYRPGQ
jgi:hypothetical protein